jgi:hypothetical protein
MTLEEYKDENTIYPSYTLKLPNILICQAKILAPISCVIFVVLEYLIKK